MDGNVIKSFLVGLGFSVDSNELAKFNKAIAGATLKVTGLYASIKLATAGIFYGISKISQGFEDLGYEFRIIAPMINKTLMLREAMLSAFRAAGLNITKAVQESVRFNFSLAKTKFALEAIYKSVGVKFLPLLTKQMDIFRKQIYANMPKIQYSLEKFIGVIFKAFEATTILGGRLWSILGRVYDFFVKLDNATNGWSTKILAVVAAWKLLNLSFLATPLGLLITGLVALLALWDDLQTFREGGKSLFNWGPIIPIIDGLVAAFTPLVNLVVALLESLWKLINLDFSGAFSSLETALEHLTTLFSNLWDAVKSLGQGIFQSVSNLGSNVKQSISDFVFSTPNLSSNLSPQNNPSSGPLFNPVGSSIQNNSSRQNVNQETNIIVQGSADANSTGKAIAGEQSRVNFDMARNMKGSVR